MCFELWKRAVWWAEWNDAPFLSWENEGTWPSEFYYGETVLVVKSFNGVLSARIGFMNTFVIANRLWILWFHLSVYLSVTHNIPVCTSSLIFVLFCPSACQFICVSTSCFASSILPRHSLSLTNPFHILSPVHPLLPASLPSLLFSLPPIPPFLPSLRLFPRTGSLIYSTTFSTSTPTAG